MADIDINSIVSDLNVKLDRDLSNITNDLSKRGALKLAGVLKETYREALSTIATNSVVGQVKPDGQILTVDQDGTLRINLVDLVYPVGAIYISVTDVNPGSLIGGTWERIQEKFLLSCSSNYPAGSTGGEFSHTLTVDEIPSHNHTGSTSVNGNHTHTRGSMEITGEMNTGDRRTHIVAGGAFYTCDAGSAPWASMSDIQGNTQGLGFAASRTWTGETSINGDHSHTVTIGNTGGSQAHNNTPPYLAVYMFKRIS